MVAFRFETGAAFGFDARQFQLFGENLSEFLHRQIDFEDMRSGRVAGLAVAPIVNVARRQRSSRFAFALTDTTRVPPAEAEVRHFDLRDRNADVVLPLFPDQLALRDVLLQVVLDFAPDNLPKPEIILLDV